MEEKLLKSKLFWIGLVIVFLLVFSVSYCNKPVKSEPISTTDSIVAKNDSLQSVIIQLDSILQANHIKYEEVRDSIHNQSVDDDCEFFTKWLSEKHR